MSFSNKSDGSHKDGPLEGPQFQHREGDDNLAPEMSEQSQLDSMNLLYPRQQLPGDDQGTSDQQIHTWIKKEFPDEDNPQIQSWDWLRPLAAKQEPGIRHGVQIKKERVVIDLTKDETPEPPKKLMPGQKLLNAMYQHQQARMVRNEAATQPTESLFVQDDDESSGSASSNFGELLPEPPENDTSGFMEIQKRFTRLVSPSIEEQIEFEKQKQVELDRRRKAKIDNLIVSHTKMVEVAEPESESISSDQECTNEASSVQQLQAIAEPDMDAAAEKFAEAKRKDTRLSKTRLEKARKAGLEMMLSKHRAPKGSKSQSQNADEPRKKAAGKPLQSPTILTNEEIRSIFENNSGHKSAKKPLTPRFVSTEKNKKKAFREMLADIQIAEKAEARADIATLDEATKTFNPSARSDGNGKWKIRGLKTSLMPNQILAASWMCKRETCNSKPHGGLLCDVMGFGKTLSALACIVNRRVPFKPEGPTLIIAPRSLTLTWSSQILQHCEKGATGGFIGYFSGKHVETEDLVCEFKNHGIVITTYSEICASYPNPKPPRDLETDAAFEEWWRTFYERKAGAFHKIHWHRIILDEAHIIRNKQTRTSIAVRALSGNFKWGLTGTPLLNRVEELYPLFIFIGVPNSYPYHTFEQSYCDGTQDAKNRLINVLRAIIHRKTHESRHMGRPFIELKNFHMRVVELDFYPAEEVIYRAIAEQFLRKVNAIPMITQNKCILTMIQKLQMFSSHPLVAEDYLKRVCKVDSPLNSRLKHWVKEETSPGTPSPSSIIAKCCLLEEQRVKMPPAAPNTQKESENSRPRPPGDPTKLVLDFHTEMKRLSEIGQYYTWDRRTWCCPSCEEIPTGAIVTSCNHLYCEECFDALGDKEGNTDGVLRMCRECKIDIHEAAFYGIHDDLDTPPPDDSEPSFNQPTSKLKRKAPQQDTTAKKRRKVRKPRITFSEWMASGDSITFDDDDENEHQAEDRSEFEDPLESKDYSKLDWIEVFGKYMPGTKFDTINAEVTKWFKEDDKAKVVIFTEYINSTKLLKYLCDKNDWKHAQITGKMANRSREIQLEKFQKDPDTKVMIASIKTGGLGLDFSVANKCILVDLWWNEAVQDQAFFRLWRLGQERDVECVMLVIKKSIDNWMRRTQQGKSQVISQVMSLKVLSDRNTIKELLEIFGQVTDDPKMGFNIDFDSTAGPGANSQLTAKATSKAKASRTRGTKK